MVLMLELKSIPLMAMAAVTAPLGLIGSALTLFLTQQPIGFVAIIGMIALSGMIIRNSIILLDQIRQHYEEGEDPYHAVIDAAVIRFRPIMLTAMAAILGMVPSWAIPSGAHGIWIQRRSPDSDAADAFFACRRCTACITK